MNNICDLKLENFNIKIHPKFSIMTNTKKMVETNFLSELVICMDRNHYDLYLRRNFLSIVLILQNIFVYGGF